MKNRKRDIKRMFNNAQMVANYSGKSIFYVLLDMSKCILNDNIGYTLIGTTTLLTTCSWAAVATVAAVGLAAYIVYDKALKDTSFGDEEGE